MQFGHLDTDETKSHKSCLTEDITTQNFSIKGFQTEDGNLVSDHQLIPKMTFQILLNPNCLLLKQVKKIVLAIIMKIQDQKTTSSRINPQKISQCSKIKIKEAEDGIT